MENLKHKETNKNKPTGSRGKLKNNSSRRIYFASPVSYYFPDNFIKLVSQIPKESESFMIRYDLPYKAASAHILLMIRHMRLNDNEVFDCTKNMISTCYFAAAKQLFSTMDYMSQILNEEYELMVSMNFSSPK